MLFCFLDKGARSLRRGGRGSTYRRIKNARPSTSFSPAGPEEARSGSAASTKVHDYMVRPSYPTHAQRKCGMRGKWSGLQRRACGQGTPCSILASPKARGSVRFHPLGEFGRTPIQVENLKWDFPHFEYPNHFISKPKSGNSHSDPG